MHYTSLKKLLQGSEHTLVVYVVALGTVAGVIVLKDWVPALAMPQVPFLLFFSAVVLSAWVGGFGPGLVATLAAAAAAHALFLTHHTAPADFTAATQIAVFTLEGVLVSVLGALRKNVDRELRSQRKWFEITLSSIGDGVIVCNAEGNITYMNNAAEALTGTEQAQALGQRMERVFNVINAHSRQPVGNVALEAVQKRRVRMLSHDTLLVTPRGREIPIEESISPIRDGEGHIIGAVSIFRDTSEQKEAEVRREAVVRSALDAIMSLDMNGHIIDFNPAAEAMFGYSRAQAVGKEAADLIVPEHLRQAHREALAHNRDSAAAPFQGRRIEIEAKRADGSYFPCELAVVRMQSAGKQIYTGFARDLTDLKRAQKAERDSERRFHIMADSAPVLVWMAGADQRCDWFNKPWLDFTGRAMEEELGEGWLAGVHADDLTTYRETFTRAFERREQFRVEYRLRRLDGVYRWMLDHGVPRYSEESSFLGYIGSCMDISEEKLIQESLQNADRRKDEFLAILGHELRNPLAAIHSATQLLERRVHGDERLEWIADTMSNQVRHMVRLLNDLLDISRITRGTIALRFQTADLRTMVVNSVNATHALFAERHQQIEMTIDKAAERVYVDPTRFEQVLTNLLTNAAKYGGERGVITLSATREADIVIIKVRDSGLGMTKELLQRAFEPFTQAVPGAGGGLGVGLALARQIMELHGGRVDAQSAGLGQGSEFTLRLPLNSEAARLALPELGAAIAQAPRDIPRRVMVVDDVAASAKLLGELLGERGYDVRTAFDGPEAIALARQFLPEVVLLDIGMPGMNGYEVARRLREEHGDRMHLVALTGYGQPEARTRALEAGFEKHLLKGLTIDDMTKELDSF